MVTQARVSWREGSSSLAQLAVESILKNPDGKHSVGAVVRCELDDDNALPLLSSWQNSQSTTAPTDGAPAATSKKPLLK